MTASGWSNSLISMTRLYSPHKRSCQPIKRDLDGWTGSPYDGMNSTVLVVSMPALKNLTASPHHARVTPKKQRSEVFELLSAELRFARCGALQSAL
jgi:hypothetical protein